MPFLKFSRDKRGYENYYLYDGKGRPRLLFWFHTPPQAKVGRAPFSDDVRTMIEAQNPDISFDWARIMSTPIPSPDVDRWRERRRVEKAAKRAAREAEAAEAAVDEAAVDEAIDDVGTVEPELTTALDATAEPDDAAAVLEAASTTQTESDTVSSDVQAAQPQGQRRRRRRRRGRRGGGGPPSGPETPPNGEV